MYGFEQEAFNTLDPRGRRVRLQMPNQWPLGERWGSLSITWGIVVVDSLRREEWSPCFEAVTLAKGVKIASGSGGIGSRIKVDQAYHLPFNLEARSP